MLNTVHASYATKPCLRASAATTYHKRRDWAIKGSYSGRQPERRGLVGLHRQRMSTTKLFHREYLDNSHDIPHKCVCIASEQPTTTTFPATLDDPPWPPFLDSTNDRVQTTTNERSRSKSFAASRAPQPIPPYYPLLDDNLHLRGDRRSRAAGYVAEPLSSRRGRPVSDPPKKCNR